MPVKQQKGRIMYKKSICGYDFQVVMETVELCTGYYAVKKVLYAGDMLNFKKEFFCFASDEHLQKLKENPLFLEKETYPRGEEHSFLLIKRDMLNMFLNDANDLYVRSICSAVLSKEWENMKENGMRDYVFVETTHAPFWIRDVAMGKYLRQPISFNAGMFPSALLQSSKYDLEALREEIHRREDLVIASDTGETLSVEWYPTQQDWDMCVKCHELDTMYLLNFVLNNVLKVQNFKK